MPQPVSRYWKYAAIILGTILLVSAIGQYHTKQAVAKTFHYDLRLKVVDAATGEPVKANLSIPGTTSADYYPQVSGVGDVDKGMVEIFGLAYTERNWKISAAGYVDEWLVIGPGSQHSGEMTIRLAKAPASAEK